MIYLLAFVVVNYALTATALFLFDSYHAHKHNNKEF